MVGDTFSGTLMVPSIAAIPPASVASGVFAGGCSHPEAAAAAFAGIPAGVGGVFGGGDTSGRDFFVGEGEAGSLHGGNVLLAAE